jgi:hypothetical protein
MVTTNLFQGLCTIEWHKIKGGMLHGLRVLASAKHENVRELIE